MLRWIDVIKYSKYGNPEPVKRIEKSDEEWRMLLTEEQFRITRLKGTEKPYSGMYCRSYEPGQYACVCCRSLLFDSVDKYNSLSGWPSFTQPIQKSALKYQLDMGHGMKRIEVMCNICDAHLGHVFPDGPEPSGIRYCINSESITRIDDKMQLAVFGGGCFWCLEALVQQVEGVISVEPGYSGGKGFNPTYKEVSSGLTGHAEMLRVKFDPVAISYEALIKIFFSIHDASLLDPEDGNYTQYRSIILFYNNDQKQAAEKVKEEIEVLSGRKIFTEIALYKAFYPAEEKHHNYFLNNPDAPYCCNIIQPKLEKLRAMHPEKLKKSGL
ncbi:peptide-methionine (R)-S-oxide reductase MsrB [Desertivirga brevis]|uniref:peptide-methionine (R)-S-oxide reductase MsrB n=1 Tax=Desertivirga brevis TaxID=2810310 RepID=UPI001A962CB2|nr:peptide-methionine (R)-S-oxide reductase MsrB [Pedobacter sp. SYSU D00873]